MILGWVHGLGQIVVFWPGRLRVLSTMIFCSVQVSLILLFRNCQVTSDPAWHLRSVGLLSFLLGIDTEPPCCIWPGRLRVLSTMVFSSFQVSPTRLFRNCQVTSDPAWHLRSVDLMLRTLIVRIRKFTMIFSNFQVRIREATMFFGRFLVQIRNFAMFFCPFSGKNFQICHVLLTFSGENPRIFHDIQKSLGCLRLQVRRIKFSLYDGVAPKDVRSFLGLSPVRRRQGCNCNLETRDLLVAGPVGRRQGYNCNLGTRDFLVAGPVGRRQGYNCNLGTGDFWWQAQLKGDRATTAIWELEIFWWQAQLKGDRATTAIWELEIFGGRPS